MKKLLIAVGMLGAVIGSADIDRTDARLDIIDTAIHNRFVDQSDLWFDDGDFPRIIQLLWLEYEGNPYDYELATDLGYMLQNVEQYDKALAVYVRYRQDNPQDPDAPWPEANFYFSKKVYARVPPLLERSISKKPHPNSYRILAHSYDRMGLFVDAKRIWTTYLKRFPNDEQAKNNLRKVEAKIKSR